MTLAAPIPLGLTSSWRTFASVAPIPHRYGTVSGRLLQYDQAGLRWVWAGHAVLGIDSITVNDKPANEWQWKNTVDSAGNPIALVEFGQPQDTSATILAAGRGKLHPVTGRLLENPGDVIWDILANVARATFAEQAFAAFRNECDTRGLVVAGSIERIDTTQAIVRALCDSVGAIFCADAPQPCRVWPGGAARPVRERLRSPVHVLKASMPLAGIVNDLTIQFDIVDGNARQTIQLDAPDSIARYGRRANTLQAAWISSPRVAHDVAQRLLAQSARPAWTITASGIKRRIDVGDDVAIDHPVLPLSTTAAVLTREWDIEQALATLTLSVPVGDAP